VSSDFADPVNKLCFSVNKYYMGLIDDARRLKKIDEGLNDKIVGQGF
jgi:hypothetical protein